MFPSLLYRAVGLLAVSLSLTAVGCCGKKKPASAFGVACTNNLDCESMSCNVARGGICTKSCQADSECGGDMICAGDPTGTGASCAKKVGVATGQPCHDRAECDHGSCLHKGESEVGFCSMRCLTGADCPAGYKVCDKIGDMGAQKLCLPGDKPDSPPPKITVKKTAPGVAPGRPPPAAK